MKNLLFVSATAILLLAGCASGAASVALPDVAGETAEEKFVNTVRGGLLEHYATWASEDVVNIGETFCRVMSMSVRDGEDPEEAVRRASADSYLNTEEVNYIIAASKRYLCPEV